MKIGEKTKTHFTLNNFFFPKIVSFITLKNLVKPERPQTTTWGKHVAWLINKATCARSCTRLQARPRKHIRIRTTHPSVHKHAEKSVILIALTRQQWLRERASVLRYTYIACPVLIPALEILTVSMKDRLFYLSISSFVNQSWSTV